MRKPQRGHGSSAVPINIRTASSRPKTMSASVALIAALLFIFVFAYMVRSIHAAFTPGVAEEVVRMTDMGRQRYVMGMIVRYEEVFYAPRDGRFVPYVNETDRVRRGTMVGRIQDTDAVARLSTDVRDVEDEIMRLNALRPYFESDATVQRINANLQNAMNGSIHHFSASNLSEINSLHDRLTQLTDTRVQIITSDGRGAVGEIGRRHEQLEEQQRRSSTNMYATETGIMFSILDRHENIVTPANMRELTRDVLATPVDHTRLFPARDVKADDPVFKIVGNTWYVAAFMPNDMVSDFVQGTERQIFLLNTQTGNYEPMTMRIEHIEQHNRESLVIFRSTRNVMHFLNQRNVSIRTTNYISRGLQISTSAISTRRFIGIPETHIHGFGNYYVLHRTAYGLEPIAIEVDSRTENTVYIREDLSGLVIGDNLAPVNLNLRDFTITEAAVKRLHGVYVTSQGSAYFTTIVLESEPLETDLHTLLDPARNANLRQFDTIATDASTVTHRQIIN